MTYNLESTEKSFQKIRSLNHPVRKNIIDFLIENGETNVTDIYVGLRLEQSYASQQLRILRDAGMVNSKRVGKSILYSLNTRQYKKIVSLVVDLNKLPGATGM